MALCDWRVGSCMRLSIAQRNVHHVVGIAVRTFLRRAHRVDASGCRKQNSRSQCPLRASWRDPIFTWSESIGEHAPTVRSCQKFRSKDHSEIFGKTKPNIINHIRSRPPLRYNNNYLR
jgi:hypothetical protein